MQVLFCLIFAFRTVKQHINILFSHDIFLDCFGESVLLVGCFIEFTSAILPQSIGVDGSKNVGNIAGQGCYCSHIFGLTFMPAYILFVMHINDYYYNTILTHHPSSQSIIYIHSSLITHHPSSSLSSITSVQLTAKSLNYNETVQR